MRTTVRRFLPVALIAAFISACADAPTSTVGFSPSRPSLHVVPIAAPQLELVILCKAGPVGTYTFDATASHAVLNDPGTGVTGLTAATYSIVVSVGSTIDVGGVVVPGACYDLSGHNHIALVSGGTDATVTVVETGIPAGVDFDHVVVYQNNAGTVSSTSSTTNSASGHAGGFGAGAALGASILFYNVPEPPPPAGCTYTKGWYQNNNGKPTVIAVDGRTIAEAQAIFEASPGQTGGVTWGVGALTNNKPNNLLNLYQQFLAALQNLGGDANEDNGPAAVDAAIDAVQAATGGSVLYISLVAGTDVGALIDVLSAFNEGDFAGWPHCGDEIVQ